MISKKLKSLLLGLGAATMLVSLASSPTLAHNHDKELIVATDTSFVPFEFKENGKYTGFDIELWEEIAGKLGLKFKWQPMDFNGIIPGLQTKNIDVALAGITIKEERKKVVDFSDPYYDSGIAILVKSSNNDIRKVEDLNGKKVAVKTGTESVAFVKSQAPKSTVSQFPNIDNAFLDLGIGNVDAVVHDTPNVQYFAKTAGNGKFKVAGLAQTGQFYGIAFPKGSDLVAKVNQALAEMKADGSYKKLYERWFGSVPESN